MNFWQRGGVWVIIQFLLFILWGLALIFMPGGRFPGFQWVGIVLTLAGVTCLLLSLFSHGKHLTPFPEPNLMLGLKTTGVYAYVRHPMYLGLLLVVFGVSLWFSQVWALIMSLILTLFFNLKARVEERSLLKVYPDYAAYRNRTGRFLPPLTKFF